MPIVMEGGDAADRYEQMSEERRRLHELLLERERAGASSGAAPPGGTNDSKQAWDPVVPIQPLGAKPPFFIVHAIRGSVFPYHQLALALGEERPVYGLQSCGLDGRNPPIETNQQMAKAYLAAVRRVQPRGPYHLGGYSMGGWIAFEMASQLRATGEDVALVAVLGTPAPAGSHRAGMDGWRYMVKYVDDLYTLVRNSAMADNLDLSKAWFAQGGMPPFGAAGAGAAGPAPGPFSSPGANVFWAALAQQTPGFRVSATNVAAQMRYIAEPCELPIDVFLTTEQTLLYWADPSMGWRDLCGDDVTVHHLHGNHLDIFRQPGVQELATILAKRLDEVRAGDDVARR